MHFSFTNLAPFHVFLGTLGIPGVGSDSWPRRPLFECAPRPDGGKDAGK